ncbi:MAG: hypothetical protein AB7I98_03770 [Verrucomicrobiales bacterium]
MRESYGRQAADEALAVEGRELLRQSWPSVPMPDRDYLIKHGATAYIWALARSIPILAAWVEGRRNESGELPVKFDAAGLVSWARDYSGSDVAAHAAFFVACLWTPYQAPSYGWRFDALEFATVASEADLAPILAWQRKPVWPHSLARSKR